MAVLALRALAFPEDLGVAFEAFPGVGRRALVPLVVAAMILIDLEWVGMNKEE